MELSCCALLFVQRPVCYSGVDCDREIVYASCFTIDKNDKTRISHSLPLVLLYGFLCT